eukprot:Rmarinus@m.617
MDNDSGSESTSSRRSINVDSLSPEQLQRILYEYSRMKQQVSSLKKSFDKKETEDRTALRQKDVQLRQALEKIDSLEFNNQRLSKRVDQLKDELEKARKTEWKIPTFLPSTRSDQRELRKAHDVLQEELEAKIAENERIHMSFFELKMEATEMAALLEKKEETITLLEDRIKQTEATKTSLNDILQKTQQTLQAREESSRDRTHRLTEALRTARYMIKRKVPFDDTRYDRFNVLNLDTEADCGWKRRAHANVLSGLDEILEDVAAAMNAHHAALSERLWLRNVSAPASEKAVNDRVVRYLKSERTTWVPVVDALRLYTSGFSGTLKEVGEAPSSGSTNDVDKLSTILLELQNLASFYDGFWPLLGEALKCHGTGEDIPCSAHVLAAHDELRQSYVGLQELTNECTRLIAEGRVTVEAASAMLQQLLEKWKTVCMAWKNRSEAENLQNFIAPVIRKSNEKVWETAEVLIDPLSRMLEQYCNFTTLNKQRIRGFPLIEESHVHGIPSRNTHAPTPVSGPVHTPLCVIMAHSEMRRHALKVRTALDQLNSRHGGHLSYSDLVLASNRVLEGKTASEAMNAGHIPSQSVSSKSEASELPPSPENQNVTETRVSYDIKGMEATYVCVCGKNLEKTPEGWYNIQIRNQTGAWMQQLSLRPSPEVVDREASLRRYFESKLGQLKSQLQIADTQAVEAKRIAQEKERITQRVAGENERLVDQIISMREDLAGCKDENSTTAQNYEEHIALLTERVVSLTEELERLQANEGI